jgi:hypothetical protein
VAFLRRRRQRLRQQNSAEDTSPHQLLIELYTFWGVLSTIEYRKLSSEKRMRTSPTNVRPSVVLEGEDYGLKVSINVKLSYRC